MYSWQKENRTNFMIPPMGCFNLIKSKIQSYFFSDKFVRDPKKKKNPNSLVDSNNKEYEKLWPAPTRSVPRYRTKKRNQEEEEEQYLWWKPCHFTRLRKEEMWRQPRTRNNGVVRHLTIHISTTNFDYPRMRYSVPLYLNDFIGFEHSFNIIINIK